jgi:hypothetical protein
LKNIVLSGLVMGVCFAPFFAAIQLALYANQYHDGIGGIVGLVGFVLSLMLCVAQGVPFVEKMGWVPDVGDYY